MFKLLGLKLKRELEEQRSLYDIEIKKRDSAIKLLEDESKSRLSLREKELVSKHDIALNEATSYLKLDYQQQLKQKELDHKREMDDLRAKTALDQAKWRQELQDENYTRLKDAMTKLHEEGNITTKFTHDLALKMLDRVPVAKSEHKYITGDVSIGAGDGEKEKEG